MCPILSQVTTVHTPQPQLLSSVLILTSTSLNDVVSIVIILRAGRSEETWMESRRAQKIHFCSKNIQTSSVVHLASHSMETWTVLQEVKGPEREADHHRIYGQGYEQVELYLHSPTYLHGMKRDHFTFALTSNLRPIFLSDPLISGFSTNICMNFSSLPTRHMTTLSVSLK